MCGNHLKRFPTSPSIDPCCCRCWVSATRVLPTLGFGRARSARLRYSLLARGDSPIVPLVVDPCDTGAFDAPSDFFAAEPVSERTDGTAEPTKPYNEFPVEHTEDRGAVAEPMPVATAKRIAVRANMVSFTILITPKRGNDDVGRPRDSRLIGSPVTLNPVNYNSQKVIRDFLSRVQLLRCTWPPSKSPFRFSHSQRLLCSKDFFKPFHSFVVSLDFYMF